MSHETYSCGCYRLTIECLPDSPPDQVISVFARLPHSNGSQQMDEVYREMSIPRLVECLVAGIREILVQPPADT